jgi:hypothetical protein
MLGAMNSKSLLIKILVNIFMLLQNYKSSILIKINFFHMSISKFLFSTLSIRSNNNNSGKKKNNLVTTDNKHNKENMWKIIKGHKGLSKYAHDKARVFIKKGKMPDTKIINDILSYCNIRITDQELKKLLNLRSYDINTKDNDRMMKEIKHIVGLPKDKNQVPGIYIFTHIHTGDKYVGSSSQLSIRLNNYIKMKDKPEGLLRPLLYEEGISKFLLEIIPIYNK